MQALGILSLMDVGSGYLMSVLQPVDRLIENL